MSELVRVLSKIGLTDLRTHIQSGNLLFTAEEADHWQSAIESKITTEIKKTLKLDVTAMVRERKSVEKLLKNPNYQSEAKKDPTKAFIGFLKIEPAKNLIDALMQKQNASAHFSVVGDSIFLFCPGGMGKAKLPAFEKVLETTVTFRNVKVVRQLIELSYFMP